MYWDNNTVVTNKWGEVSENTVTDLSDLLLEGLSPRFPYSTLAGRHRYFIQNGLVPDLYLLFSLMTLSPSLYPRPTKSARGGHASLGRLCVPMSESVHGESLNTSIPTPLSLPVFLSLPPSLLPFPFNNTTTLHPLISLCLRSQLFLQIAFTFSAALSLVFSQ